MANIHWPDPLFQSRTYMRWGGFGNEIFDPVIHLPPNVYKLYLFKHIRKVRIHTNASPEPHVFGDWGAPTPNLFPDGPFYVVGMESSPQDQGVYITQTRPGPTFGHIYLVWSRWLRVTETRLLPRDFVGPIDLPPPPVFSRNQPLPLPLPNNVQAPMEEDGK